MFRNPIVDLAVVALIALLIFGPKRLPQLGRGLGHGFREFKDGITGKSTTDDPEERPALTPATTTSHEPAGEPSSSEASSTERSA